MWTYVPVVVFRTGTGGPSSFKFVCRCSALRQVHTAVHAAVRELPVRDNKTCSTMAAGFGLFKQLLAEPDVHVDTDNAGWPWASVDVGGIHVDSEQSASLLQKGLSQRHQDTLATVRQPKTIALATPSTFAVVMLLPLLCLGIVVAQNASSCTLARECDSTAKSHSATLMVGDRAVELDVASLSRARALAHLSTVSSRRQYNLKQEVDTLMSIIGETTTAWTVSIYCPVVASSLCYVSVHCSRLCRARYKACARGLTSHESATGGDSTHRVPT